MGAEVLPHIPDWMWQKQCRECLQMQLFTMKIHFRTALPAIVEIQEYHADICSRYPHQLEYVKFILTEKP